MSNIERHGELQDGKPEKTQQVTEKKSRTPSKYDPAQPPDGYDSMTWRLMRRFVEGAQFWARIDLEPKKFIVYQRLAYCLEQSGLPDEHDTEVIVQLMFIEFWNNVYSGDFDPIEEMFSALTWEKIRRIVLLQEQAKEARLKALAEGEGQTPAPYHAIDRSVNPAEKPRHKLGRPTDPSTVVIGEWPEDVQDWIRRHTPREGSE